MFSDIPGMSHFAAEASREITPWAAPRYSLRPSDRILVAFKDACEDGDLEVAAQLLHVIEMIIARRTVHPDRRRHHDIERLVAGQRLLWRLRHPDACGEAEQVAVASAAA